MKKSFIDINFIIIILNIFNQYLNSVIQMSWMFSVRKREKRDEEWWCAWGQLIGYRKNRKHTNPEALPINIQYFDLWIKNATKGHNPIRIKNNPCPDK